MQDVVSVLYYAAVVYFAAGLVWNLLDTRDPQKTLLYLVVLAPFAMRILRLK